MEDKHFNIPNLEIIGFKETPPFSSGIVYNIDNGLNIIYYYTGKLVLSGNELNRILDINFNELKTLIKILKK